MQEINQWQEREVQAINNVHSQGAEGALLSNIFESIGSELNYGVMILNKDSRVVFCNDATSSMLNLPKDLVITGRCGIKVFKFMYERGDMALGDTRISLEAHLVELERAQSSGLQSTRKWSQIRPDGSHIQVNRVAMADGHTIFTITERTAAARRDKMLKIALKSANAGYWSFSFQNKKFKFSDHIRDQFSANELAKIEDKGLWAIIHPEDVGQVRKAWIGGFKSSDTFEFTHRVNLDKGGVKYFRNIGNPEFADNGKPIGITCFISDVTQQKLDAEALTQAKDVAETSLQANNDFLARMSHEIRTPMNGIVGMADALVHSGRCDGVIEQLGVIKTSAGNMLRVLDETLEHAKLNSNNISIKPERAEPHKLLKDIISLWEQKAKDNGTKLTLHIDDSIPHNFVFDSFRYQQCLNNLISNAVKFTQNGHIRLIATLIEKEGQAPIYVTAVKDNGIGMNREQQSRVFTPYTQADDSITERFGGTGLGMNITKGLVSLMQGDISLKSKEGDGTTFIISLPCAEMEASPAASSHSQETPIIAKEITQESEQNPPKVNQAIPARQDSRQDLKSAHTILFSQSPPKDEFKNLKLLIAEDNATNQLVVKALLEPIVGEIYFAENGAEAIEILKTKPVDIVLMDIHMPVMDGIEATIAIRSENAPWSNIGIIALTADPEYQQKRICRNIGMNDAIAKPVSRSEVLDAFRSVLEEVSQKAISTPSVHAISA